MEAYLRSLAFPQEAVQLLVAAFIGLLIGFERAYRGKVASLRTFSMISTGSCLFTILSVHGAPTTESHPDITRIAAQVVSGVGFIGAGVIFKQSGRIEGITSASMIWMTAALGMCCGFNQLSLVGWAAALVALLIVTSNILHRGLSYLRLQRRRNHHAEHAGNLHS